MPAAWAVVAKLGLVLAIIGTLWALLRWVLKRAEDKQSYQDKIAQMQRERAELEAKLRAAIMALEVIREAKRDPVLGLPAGIVQSRQKPDDRQVGQPPAG